MNRLTLDNLERMSLKISRLVDTQDWKSIGEHYRKFCFDEKMPDPGVEYLAIWCFFVGMQTKHYLLLREFLYPKEVSDVEQKNS